MDNSAIFADEHLGSRVMLRSNAIRRTCETLFYCSLLLLALTVVFSSKIIQIITFTSSIFLGLSMLLSHKEYSLAALYIFNITLLTAITCVPFYSSGFHASFITFIPLLVGNKFLLRDTKHFWYLLVLNIVVALIYILLANQEVRSNGFIIDGLIFFMNVFIIIKILYYVEIETKLIAKEKTRRIQFLEGIIDINPQLIFAKDKQGKFTFTNKLFADSIGLTQEEILGKTDFEIGIPKEKALSYMSTDIAVMDSGTKNQIFEERIDSDGELKYFQSIIAPTKDNEGNISGVFGISMDRSAEKRNEKKLFDSKLLYQTLFDNLNDGVIVYDFQSERMDSCNDSAMKILKLDKNKVDLKKFDRFHFFPKTINGIDVHAELANHKERIMNSQVIKGNAIMKRLDGELFESKLSVYPNPGQNGQGIIVIKDISIEAKAKREIIRSKNYFMQIYDNSPVAISMTCIETLQIYDINATHQKVFGYTLEKLESMNIEKLVPDIKREDQTRIIEKLRSGEIDKYVVEREYIHNTGKKLNVRTHQTLVTKDSKEYLMEFMEDVTEIKRQEARYKFLFENAFDGITINDYSKKELIDYNSKFKDFLSLDASFEARDHSTLDYSPELQDNGMSSTESFAKNNTLLKEKGSLEFNWKFQLKNGDIKYADISLMQDESTQQKLTYAIYRETTEARLTQLALKESEKRFRLIFDNAFDGLYFFNYKTQQMILGNSKLYELFETTPDRLLIDKPHLKPEMQPDGISTLEKMRKTLEETLQKGKSRATRIFVKSDGTVVHLEISTFLLSPPDDDILVSIYKDITDQKTAERIQILNATQEEKLDVLSRELSSYTLFTTQKTKLLQELSEDLKIMATMETRDSKMMAEKVKRKIDQNLDEKENWLSFKVQFERVHPGFFNKLEQKFDDISTNDLKHCAYIKMGLSNSEIADILFIGKKAVEMSHYRLKKKLGFPKELTLKKALQQL